MLAVLHRAREAVSDFAHWFNVPFTIGTFTLDLDAQLKLAAFLFVTVPLGVVQWWNLADRWKERKKKINASKQPVSEGAL